MFWEVVYLRERGLDTTIYLASAQKTCRIFTFAIHHSELARHTSGFIYMNIYRLDHTSCESASTIDKGLAPAMGTIQGRLHKERAGGEICQKGTI